MGNKDLSNSLEIIKKFFETKNPYQTFDAISSEFVKLLAGHYTLIDHIGSIERLMDGTEHVDTLAAVKHALNENAVKIVGIIGLVIKRKIVVHPVQKGDSLWKISKKYGSNMKEIFELNNMKSIFILNETKVILVPLEHNCQE